MPQMRKSLILFFIVLGLLIGLTPSDAALANTYYDIWVEGTRVSVDNANDVLGDGGSVSYNDVTKTLTLNNAKLMSKRNPKAALPNSNWSYHNAAILTKTPLNIELKGKNTVTIDSKTTDLIRAIGFFESGHIVGKGSLDITGKVKVSRATGIFCYKDCTIGEEADISMNIENTHQGGSAYANTEGISVKTNLTIGKESNLHILIHGASLSHGIQAGNQLIVRDDAMVTCNVDGKKNNSIECGDMLITDRTTVNSVSGQGDYDNAALYCRNTLTINGQAKVNCDLKGNIRSHGISAYGKTTISDKAVVHTRSQGNNYNYGVRYQVTLNDDARFIAAGSKLALSEKPVLNISEKMVAKVSNNFEGTDATTWDGKTDLGGTGSAYKYVEIKELAYTVIFDDNYPEGAAPIIKYTDDWVTFPDDPVRANHNFLGWNTAQDGSGHDVTADYIFRADTTLYAQWKKRSEVTFDHNYSDAPAPTVLKANGADKLDAFPPTPIRKGYRFSGWNTARDGSGTAITKDHVFTTDTTLYAQWLKSERGGNKTYGDYSGNGTGPLVNFDPNYTNAPAAESKRADKNGKFAQLPAPKREGHLFLGWFKDKDGSGTALTADHVFTNGETVYAKWADGKDALRVIMTIGSHDYLVNDVAKTMDTVPFIEKDRTFVPIRALAEAFGAEVIWDGNERSVTIKDGDKTVLMTIGDKSYRVNDESKEMDVAPFINKDNRTMIPVRFATEALGYQVDYQQKDEVAKVIFTRG